MEHGHKTAVLSDVVNTAARLESLTKSHQETILIGSSTVDIASNPERFRKLGAVQVKGKLKTVDIYTL